MLTKTEARELRSILEGLKQGKQFIMSEDFLFMRPTKYPNNLDYTRANGDGSAVTGPINKQVGSDLCYLWNNIRNLEKFLAAHAPDTEQATPEDQFNREYEAALKAGERVFGPLFG